MKNRNWKQVMGIWGSFRQISNFKFRISAFVLLIALAAAACSGDSAHEHDSYTCPMHPTVVSDKPGACPICGMDLVRKARPGEEVKITEDLTPLLKSPNEIIPASEATIKGEYKSVPVSVEALGVVTYDTRNIYTIPAQVGGRIEKVYLKYEFQKVNKGQKVAEIYSPELITAQRELLFLIENDPENELLIQSSKTRLKLLGMRDSQIYNLTKRRAVTNAFAIHSPYQGFVITDEDTPSSGAPMSTPSPFVTGASASMDGMGASAISAQKSTAGGQTRSGSLIREGSYVSTGQTLFKIVNTEALRIELDVHGTNSDVIREGDRVELDLGNGKNEIATVDLVQPFYSEGQNFLKVRVYPGKTNEMQIGQLVRAKIRSEDKEALWLPKEAILDLGNEKIVFLRERGILKPKKVVTGIRSDNLIEIKSGLASDEEVAANAQYLVDSESFIRVE